MILAKTELHSVFVEKEQKVYIQRHIEKVVERISKKKPVLIVTGARQVGKTTMLKQMYNLNYVTMNTAATRQSAKESPSIFFDYNKLPIIVDEIQKAPELFEYVKEIVDGKKMHGQFYLTGSQSFKLMQNITESLAGRAGIIQMMGVSLRELSGKEYYEPFKPTNEHIEQMRDVKKFGFEKMLGIIHKGSFPELYETETSLKDWSDYHNGYFQTYIERDVREIINIKDELSFVKFVKATAARTGQQLNYSALAEVCGKDEKTVKNWLSVLQANGLIYLLEPYYNNFNKRLSKTPKLYFLDTGLACYLLGWHTPTQMHEGAMWGQIFETYIVGEIIKSYYNDGRTLLPLYYYRDKEKNEIDLITEEAGTLYPIEIKTTSDPNKSMIKAFEMLKKIPDKKIGSGGIVCMSKEILPLAGGNWIIPVEVI
jgi:predicted AAA+ superfamily ATPase